MVTFGHVSLFEAGSLLNHTLLFGPFGHVSGFGAGAPFGHVYPLNSLIAFLSDLSSRLAAASIVGPHPTPHIHNFPLRNPYICVLLMGVDLS